MESKAVEVNSVVLAYGIVLTFEASSLVPAEAETIPCPRHGYCKVQRRTISAGGARPRRPRPAPREHQELIDWLQTQPSTTVHVLRRHRFTLRIISEAQRAGLVEADLVTGLVALRPIGQRESRGSK